MRPFDLVGTVGAWTVFAGTLFVFDPVLRIARAFGERPMDRAVSAMCRVLSWSIPAGLCRLRLEGLENVPPGGRVIVVSNHQSLVESFLPLWALDHLRPRFVAKREMASWIPAVSFNLRAAGHCLISRKDRDGSVEAIRGLGRRVAAGECSAMIFPEGTRSASGLLNRFKLAGLAALIEEAPGVPILPVVFHGGHRVFPRGKPRVRAFSTVTMRVMPAMEREERALDEFVSLVHGVLTATFAELEGRQSQAGGRETHPSRSRGPRAPAGDSPGGEPESATG